MRRSQTSSIFIIRRAFSSGMKVQCPGRTNLYQLRIQKETALSEEQIQERIRWDMPVLSSNPKCSVSLDLPALNCTPTAVCAEVCYAAQGRQIYRKAIIKSLAVNRMIDDDPEHVARKVVDEAAGRAIRLAGSGEILPEHNALVDHINRLGGEWWGFTRRIDTHRALPNLMFSLDASTPDPVLQYVRQEVPTRRRAYLRRSGDAPPPLEVAVVFPVHGPRTDYVDTTPQHERDCPAGRKEIAGCWRCRRCY